MHHKKAEHHLKEAAKHHEAAKAHMSKIKHDDVKEDKKLIKASVKKDCMKK